MLYMIENLS
jgi:hypothetical protein